MVRTRSSYYLCEELIFKILSLLPVISLLRCKLVCKLWRSIISNPKFVETHLTNSSYKNRQVTLLNIALVVTRNDDECVDPIIYIYTREYSLRLPPLLKLRLVGTCNGLVCLANFKKDVIYVWNPLTTLFKILPTPKIEYNCIPLTLGFGFDSVSNDYKFLRIMFATNKLEAELYSVNADCWKKIQVPETVQSFWPHPFTKCVDSIGRVLYVEGLHMLLSFDLHTEVFGVYPFPDSVKHEGKSKFLDFDGSVAMIFELFGDESVVSLWTLDDVCAEVSWTKKFNLKPDLGIQWVDLYLGAGRFVVNNYNGHFYYDHEKKETGEPLPSGSGEVISVVKYTESLVTLKGFEQQE